MGNTALRQKTGDKKCISTERYQELLPPPHGNNNNNNNNNNNKIDRTVPNNKPDIIIRDNEKGTCALIDVAISGDRNVIKEEDEKILKYKDLTIEI